MAKILSTFYNKFSYARDGKRLAHSVLCERYKGFKAVADLIDADTGEVVVEAGKKLTAAHGQAARRQGPQGHPRDRRRSLGTYLAEDIVNYQTGEIYLEAGDEIDEKKLQGPDRAWA
jgi:DNA-directed RNA polymerase subunit beta